MGCVHPATGRVIGYRTQVGTTPYDPLYLKSIQTQRNLFSQEQTGPRKKIFSQNLEQTDQEKIYFPKSQKTVLASNSSYNGPIFNFFDVLKSPGPPLSFIPYIISPRLSENASAVTPNKFIFPESGTNRPAK